MRKHRAVQIITFARSAVEERHIDEICEVHGHRHRHHKSCAEREYSDENIKRERKYPHDEKQRKQRAEMTEGIFYGKPERREYFLSSTTTDGDHAEISEYLSDKNISNADDKAVGARITDILPKSLPIKNTITYMSAS